MVMMSEVLKPVFRLVLLIGLAALLALTGALFVSHLRAQMVPDSPQACLDELLVRWNEFAGEANRHIQTNEVRREAHGQTHARLDREWPALKALSCW
jgi:hypothetical protein